MFLPFDLTLSNKLIMRASHLFFFTISEQEGHRITFDWLTSFSFIWVGIDWNERAEKTPGMEAWVDSRPLAASANVEWKNNR